MRKKRNLGAMRHKILLKNIVRTPDGGGGYARADTDNLPFVMGRVETLSVNEIAAYGRLEQRVSHRVTIRRKAEVKQGVTVVWQKPTGDISLYVATVNDPRPDRPDEWMELICREGGNL